MEAAISQRSSLLHNSTRQTAASFSNPLATGVNNHNAAAKHNANEEEDGVTGAMGVGGELLTSVTMPAATVLMVATVAVTTRLNLASGNHHTREDALVAGHPRAGGNRIGNVGADAQIEGEAQTAATTDAVPIAHTNTGSNTANAAAGRGSNTARRHRREQARVGRRGALANGRHGGEVALPPCLSDAVRAAAERRAAREVNTRVRARHHLHQLVYERRVAATSRMNGEGEGGASSRSASVGAPPSHGHGGGGGSTPPANNSFNSVAAAISNAIFEPIKRALSSGKPTYHGAAAGDMHAGNNNGAPHALGTIRSISVISTLSEQQATRPETISAGHQKCIIKKNAAPSSSTLMRSQCGDVMQARRSTAHNVGDDDDDDEGREDGEGEASGDEGEEFVIPREEDDRHAVKMGEGWRSAPHGSASGVATATLLSRLAAEKAHLDAQGDKHHPCEHLPYDEQQQQYPSVSDDSAAAIAMVSSPACSATMGRGIDTADGSNNLDEEAVVAANFSSSRAAAILSTLVSERDESTNNTGAAAAGAHGSNSNALFARMGVAARTHSSLLPLPAVSSSSGLVLLPPSAPSDSCVPREEDYQHQHTMSPEGGAMSCQRSGHHASHPIAPPPPLPTVVLLPAQPSTLSSCDGEGASLGASSSSSVAHRIADLLVAHPLLAAFVSVPSAALNSPASLGLKSLGLLTTPATPHPTMKKKKQSAGPTAGSGTASPLPTLSDDFAATLPPMLQGSETRCLFETPLWREPALVVPPSSLSLLVTLRNPTAIPVRFLKQHGSRAFDWSVVAKFTAVPLSMNVGLSEAAMYQCLLDIRHPSGTANHHGGAIDGRRRREAAHKSKKQLLLAGDGAADGGRLLLRKRDRIRSFFDRKSTTSGSGPSAEDGGLHKALLPSSSSQRNTKRENENFREDGSSENSPRRGLLDRFREKRGERGGGREQCAGGSSVVFSLVHSSALTESDDCRGAGGHRHDSSSRSSSSTSTRTNSSDSTADHRRRARARASGLSAATSSRRRDDGDGSHCSSASLDDLSSSDDDQPIPLHSYQGVIEGNTMPIRSITAWGHGAGMGMSPPPARPILPPSVAADSSQQRQASYSNAAAAASPGYFAVGDPASCPTSPNLGIAGVGPPQHHREQSTSSFSLLPSSFANNNKRQQHVKVNVATASPNPKSNTSLFGNPKKMNIPLTVCDALTDPIRYYIDTMVLPPPPPYRGNAIERCGSPTGRGGAATTTHGEDGGGLPVFRHHQRETVVVGGGGEPANVNPNPSSIVSNQTANRRNTTAANNNPNDTQQPPQPQHATAHSSLTKSLSMRLKSISDFFAAPPTTTAPATQQQQQQQPTANNSGSSHVALAGGGGGGGVGLSTTNINRNTYTSSWFPDDIGGHSGVLASSNPHRQKEVSRSDEHQQEVIAGLHIIADGSGCFGQSPMATAHPHSHAKRVSGDSSIDGPSLIGGGGSGGGGGGPSSAAIFDVLTPLESISSPPPQGASAVIRGNGLPQKSAMMLLSSSSSPHVAQHQDTNLRAPLHSPPSHHHDHPSAGAMSLPPQPASYPNRLPSPLQQKQPRPNTVTNRLLVGPAVGIPSSPPPPPLLTARQFKQRQAQFLKAMAAMEAKDRQTARDLRRRWRSTQTHRLHRRPPPPPLMLVMKYYDTELVDSPNMLIRFTRHVTSTTAEVFARHELRFYELLAPLFCENSLYFSPFHLQTEQNEAIATLQRKQQQLQQRLQITGAQREAKAIQKCTATGQPVVAYCTDVGSAGAGALRNSPELLPTAVALGVGREVPPSMKRVPSAFITDDGFGTLAIGCGGATSRDTIRNRRRQQRMLQQQQQQQQGELDENEDSFGVMVARSVPAMPSLPMASTSSNHALLTVDALGATATFNDNSVRLGNATGGGRDGRDGSTARRPSSPRQPSRTAGGGGLLPPLHPATIQVTTPFVAPIHVSDGNGNAATMTTTLVPLVGPTSSGDENGHPVPLLDPFSESYVGGVDGGPHTACSSPTGRHNTNVLSSTNSNTMCFPLAGTNVHHHHDGGMMMASSSSAFPVGATAASTMHMAAGADGFGRASGGRSPSLGIGIGGHFPFPSTDAIGGSGRVHRGDASVINTRRSGSTPTMFVPPALLKQRGERGESGGALLHGLVGDDHYDAPFGANPVDQRGGEFEGSTAADGASDGVSFFARPRETAQREALAMPPPAGDSSSQSSSSSSDSDCSICRERRKSSGAGATSGRHHHHHANAVAGATLSNKSILKRALVTLKNVFAAKKAPTEEEARKRGRESKTQPLPSLPAGGGDTDNDDSDVFKTLSAPVAFSTERDMFLLLRPGGHPHLKSMRRQARRHAAVVAANNRARQAALLLQQQRQQEQQRHRDDAALDSISHYSPPPSFAPSDGNDGNGGGAATAVTCDPPPNHHASPLGQNLCCHTGNAFPSADGLAPAAAEMFTPVKAPATRQPTPSKAADADNSGVKTPPPPSKTTAVLDGGSRANNSGGGRVGSEILVPPSAPQSPLLTARQQKVVPGWSNRPSSMNRCEHSGGGGGGRTTGGDGPLSFVSPTMPPPPSWQAQHQRRPPITQSMLNQEQQQMLMVGTAPSPRPTSTSRRPPRRYDYTSHLAGNMRCPFRVPTVYFLGAYNKGLPSLLRYVCCAEGSGSVVAIGLEDMRQAGYSFAHGQLGLAKKSEGSGSPSAGATLDVKTAVAKRNGITKVGVPAIVDGPSPPAALALGGSPNNNNQQQETAFVGTLHPTLGSDRVAALAATKRPSGALVASGHVHPLFVATSSCCPPPTQSRPPHIEEESFVFRSPLRADVPGLHSERYICAVLRGIAYLHSVMWGRSDEPVVRSELAASPIPRLIHRVVAEEGSGNSGSNGRANGRQASQAAVADQSHGQSNTDEKAFPRRSVKIVDAREKEEDNSNSDGGGGEDNRRSVRRSGHNSHSQQKQQQQNTMATSLLKMGFSKSLRSVKNVKAQFEKWFAYKPTDVLMLVEVQDAICFIHDRWETIREESLRIVSSRETVIHGDAHYKNCGFKVLPSGVRIVGGGGGSRRGGSDEAMEGYFSSSDCSEEVGSSSSSSEAPNAAAAGGCDTNAGFGSFTGSALTENGSGVMMAMAAAHNDKEPPHDESPDPTARRRQGKSKPSAGRHSRRRGAQPSPPNPLLQYEDEDQMLQSCFLDFQSCGGGSVAAELLYFICTSCPVEVLEEETISSTFEEFILAKSSRTYRKRQQQGISDAMRAALEKDTRGMMDIGHNGEEGKGCGDAPESCSSIEGEESGGSEGDHSATVVEPSLTVTMPHATDLVVYKVAVPRVTLNITTHATTQIVASQEGDDELGGQQEALVVHPSSAVSDNGARAFLGVADEGGVGNSSSSLVVVSPQEISPYPSNRPLFGANEDDDTYTTAAHVAPTTPSRHAHALVCGPAATTQSPGFSLAGSFVSNNIGYTHNNSMATGGGGVFNSMASHQQSSYTHTRGGGGSHHANNTIRTSLLDALSPSSALSPFTGRAASRRLIGSTPSLAAPLGRGDAASLSAAGAPHSHSHSAVAPVVTLALVPTSAMMVARPTSYADDVARRNDADDRKKNKAARKKQREEGADSSTAVSVGGRSDTNSTTTTAAVSNTTTYHGKGNALNFNRGIREAREEQQQREEKGGSDGPNASSAAAPSASDSTAAKKQSTSRKLNLAELFLYDNAIIDFYYERLMAGPKAGYVPSSASVFAGSPFMMQQGSGGDGNANSDDAAPLPTTEGFPDTTNLRRGGHLDEDGDDVNHRTGAARATIPLTRDRLVREVYMLARHWAGCLVFDLASSNPAERARLKRIKAFKEMLDWSEQTSRRVMLMAASVYVAVDKHIETFDANCEALAKAASAVERAQRGAQAAKEEEVAAMTAAAAANSLRPIVLENQPKNGTTSLGVAGQHSHSYYPDHRRRLHHYHASVVSAVTPTTPPSSSTATHHHIFPPPSHVAPSLPGSPGPPPEEGEGAGGPLGAAAVETAAGTMSHLHVSFDTRPELAMRSETDTFVV